MQKIILIGLLVFSVCFSFAQNDVRSQINDIKRSGDYITAEATDSILNNAEQTAEALLIQEIADYLAEMGKGTDKAALANITALKQDLSMMRGRYHRVFVYISKSDIITLPNGTKLVDLPKSDVKPLPTKPVEVEKVVKEEPVKRTPAENLNEILSVSTFTELKPIFARLKEEGSIEYSAFRGESDVTGECYLLFYDRQGNIKALLSKKENNYSEIKTGNSVRLSAYSGLGAYWFKLK